MNYISLSLRLRSQLRASYDTYSFHPVMDGVYKPLLVQLCELARAAVVTYEILL